MTFSVFLVLCVNRQQPMVSLKGFVTGTLHALDIPHACAKLNQFLETGIVVMHTLAPWWRIVLQKWPACMAII